MDGFVSCDVFVGYRAVYRISFAMAVFFFLLSLLMIEVKTSNDPRASVHNGYVCEPAVSSSNLFLLSSFCGTQWQIVYEYIDGLEFLLN